MRYDTAPVSQLNTAIADTERLIAKADPQAALAALRRARRIYTGSLDVWHTVALGPVHERLAAAEIAMAELLTGRAMVSLK